MQVFQYHVFVCDQVKPEGVPCCSARGGSAYSQDEYAQWLRDAGFATVEHLPLAGPTGLMIGIKR